MNPSRWFIAALGAVFVFGELVLGISLFRLQVLNVAESRESQAIQTIRTRNTDGIALPTFLMMGIGSACFMLQGILHQPDTLWALFITNLITTICSCIVFGIKIYNDFFKKKS